MKQFKKSKLGFIPEEWDVKSVKELMEDDILSQPLDGNHGEIHPKGTDFVEAGIPFIMASDLKDGIVNYKNCKFIRKEQADKLRKGFAKDGDILLSHKASIGKVAYLTKTEYPYVMLTPQVTYYRVKDVSKLDSYYLKFYFEVNVFQSTINLWASSGSTRDYIGITEQQKLPILLPDITTQNGIASILKSYDELIEVNNQRIKLLEETAQQIYKEWFVRMRFPGYKEVKVVKGIPHGWEIKKLGDISELINRGVSPTYDENGDSVVLNQRCIRDNRIDLQIGRNQIKKVPLQKILKYGDVLINSTGEGTLGRTAQLHEQIAGLTADSHLTIARAKSGFSIEYYGMFINSLENYFELMALGSTGQTELGRKVIANVMIKVPPKELLDKFSNFISPINKQLINLLKQNTQLRQIRDRLLPRLISGRIEIKDFQIAGKIIPLQIPKSKNSEKELASKILPKSNPYFKRSVLAAYLIDRLRTENSFGHVKLMKMMYLCEHLAEIETLSNYHRDAAGPYDNQMIRSIDSQLKKSKWFDCVKMDQKYTYQPLEKKEEYKKWFIEYYKDKKIGIESLISIFGTQKTVEAEKVATLYEANRSLKLKNNPFTDTDVINEVLHNWHESKQRISEAEWSSCLDWMREKAWIN